MLIIGHFINLYLYVVEQVDGSVRTLQQRHAQSRGLNWGQEQSPVPQTHHVVKASEARKIPYKTFTKLV